MNGRNGNAAASRSSSKTAVEIPPTRPSSLNGKPPAQRRHVSTHIRANSADQLVSRVSRMSVQGPGQGPNQSQPTAGLPPPPPYPSSGPSNEDLNRYVSSSTAASGTTNMSSVPSMVKHSGPTGPNGAHQPPSKMTRIAPSDVQGLPERIGAMMYDKASMKWVKARARNGSGGNGRADQTHTSSGSEDPFRDFESLKGDGEAEDGEGLGPYAQEEFDQEGEVAGGMSIIEEASEHEHEHEYDLDHHHHHHQHEYDEDDTHQADNEEVELTSFSLDPPSAAGVVHIMTGEHTVEMADMYDDETTDSADEEDPNLQEQRTVRYAEHELRMHEMKDATDTETDSSPRKSSVGGGGGRPHIPISSSEPLLSVPSSVQAVQGSPNPMWLGTPNRVGSAPTPIRSVLKNGNSSTPVLVAPRGGSGRSWQTPAQRRLHQRSVSFSDGKREGQIHGLSRREGEGDGASIQPSARTKRINDLLDHMDHEDDSDDSPSKTSNAAGRLAAAKPLQNFGSWPAASTPAERSRRSFGRSQSYRPSFADRTAMNATFLTECSFGVAHDRLVQVITDVEPYEPNWEDLAAIDLSGKQVETVVRLKEFLPKLNTLNL